LQLLFQPPQIPEQIDLMEKIPLAAILAGGRSTRMGTDKSALVLGDKPLIEWVIEAVSPISERVAIVGGGCDLKNPSVEFVPDRYPGAASMGGIATALAYAQETIGSDAWILCVACDMPFLSAELLLHIYSKKNACDSEDCQAIVAPATKNGPEPLCALYSAQTLRIFEAEIKKQNYRIRDVFRLAHTVVVHENDLRRFDPNFRSFMNINSPADFKAAEINLEKAGIK